MEILHNTKQKVGIRKSMYKPIQEQRSFPEMNNG